MTFNIINQKYYSLLFLLSILMLISCGRDRATNIGYVSEGHEVPYALNYPDTTFVLPRSLNEISGLTYDPVEDALLAVDDEKGAIFILNKTTGAIEKEIKIDKKNDYEGIEIVGNLIMMLESDGDIHFFPKDDPDNLDKIENKFDSDNDLEGIAHIPTRDIILFACKDEGLDDDDKYTKYIYQAPLDDLEDITLYSKIDLSKNFDKLTSIDLKKGLFTNIVVSKRLQEFGPSGLAVRPENEEIYVLSSRGGLLVVIDPVDFEVKSILFLRKSVHVQPEGICFDNYGTLYISNEARGKKAEIHVYKPKDAIKVLNDSTQNPMKVLQTLDSIISDSTE